MTDLKPLLVCFICNALLTKAHRLMTNCVKADTILTQMMKAEEEIPMKFTTMELKATAVETCTISQSVDIEFGSVKVEEQTHLDTPDLYQEDFQMETESVHKDELTSDSEDDIPLNSIKKNQLIPTTSKKHTKLKAVTKKKNFKEKLLKKQLKTIGKETLSEYKDSMDENKASLVVAPTYTKIELSPEQQMENFLERAKSDNYLHSPYKCDLCYRGFVDATAFENHRDKHDERRGAFACAVCALRYGSARRARTHELAAHALLFKCAQCDHVAHTHNQARVHEKWHTGFKYDCKLCGREFKKPTTYLSHLRTSHTTEHVCEVCGDNFAGEHGLKMHKTKVHADNLKNESTEEPAEERYCSECDIQFHSKLAWQKHVVCSYKHSLKNELNSRCALCGWVCTSGSRARHMRSHALALRDRTQCARPAHVALQCRQCSSSFSRRSVLEAHVRRVHLGLRYNKNTVCEICGKNCTSYATLRYHQRVHTGERPYVCLTCSKRFADSNQLRIHTRTHTGERPYECAACGKRFSQKPALTRHYRVHTGAKPYSCTLCSRSFTQSSSLKLHVRSVHSKQPGDKRRRQKPPADTLVSEQT